jgi:hypothetical protein
MTTEPGSRDEAVLEHPAAADARVDAAADAADAAETDRMVGQVLDDGSRAMAGERVTPGTSAPLDAASRAAEDVDALVEHTLLTSLLATVPDVSRGPVPAAEQRSRRLWMVAGTALVGLIGFVGGLILLGGSGGSPSGSAAPGAAAIVASPSAGPTLAATPEPTPVATPTPGPTPAASTPAVQSVTLRGPIDVRAMSKAGLQMGQHDVELVVFLDNGKVTGTFVLVVEEFPIGELMAALDKGISGSNDAHFAAFKACKTRMRLEGDATGTYDPKTHRLSGKVVFQPVSEDVHDCLKNKPKQITIDPNDAVKTSTVKWSATFDGTKAKGTLALDPVTPFTATREE